MAKRKRVTIEWTDAKGYSGWWPPDAQFDVSRCITTGFLLRETKEFVSLAQSFDDKGSPGDVMVIPKNRMTKRST